MNILVEKKTAEKAQHDKLVSLVENMLKLHKKYHDARMERDKENSEGYRPLGR